MNAPNNVQDNVQDNVPSKGPNLRRVFLVGPMGVGKTSIGRQIAHQLKFSFIDSDQEIEKRAGANISWIFDVEGEEGFRKREESVIDDLSQRSDIVLATGGGAVVSEANRARLFSRGVVCFLDAQVETLVDRTLNDKKRPLLQVENKEERILSIYYERLPLYQEITHLHIYTDAGKIKDIAHLVVRSIQSLSH